MPVMADRQSQLLIDGKLVVGRGGVFDTVNPAAEEVLGVAADADDEDMGNAVEAARRAFDDTEWSTNTALRVRCCAAHAHSRCAVGRPIDDLLVLGRRG